MALYELQRSAGKKEGSTECLRANNGQPTSMSVRFLILRYLGGQNLGLPCVRALRNDSLDVYLAIPIQVKET